MNDVMQVLALRATNPPGATDATAFRLRLAHVLERADLRPPGMPPAAVLIIRKLADPLPGVLRPRPAVPADPAWEQAGRAALAAAWRGAARPARGSVAADATAVAFADEGEWLACRLDDLVRGRARWWWRQVIAPTAAAAATVTPSTLMFAHRLSLPAAFAHLAADGRAAAVAALVPAPDAARLADQLAADAGLPVLNTASPGAAVEAASDLPTGRLAGPAEEHRVAGDEIAPAPLATADRRMAAAARPDFAAAVLQLAEQAGLALSPLSPPQRLLVALAVGLQRWPRAVHQAAATTPVTLPVPAVAMQSVSVDEPRGARGGPPAAAGEARTSVAEASLGDAVATPPQPADNDLRPVRHQAGRQSDEPPPKPIATAPNQPPPAAGGEAPAVIPALPAATPDSLPAPAPRAATDGGKLPSTATGPSHTEADHATPNADARVQANSAAADDRRVWPEDGLPSGLAGAGFLINLMLHLDLPEAFEPRWGLSRRLGPWGTLAVLAAGLIDDPAPEDPLWMALDTLAGPPAETDLPPPPAAFRWPPGWLALAGVKTPPRRPELIPAAAAARAGPALAPLFGRLLPVLRRRLQRALGDTSPAAMLRRPGRIHLTATHVDLVLPLAAISLPARRAGLDRDPGWLPGWGRVVLFHFE